MSSRHSLLLRQIRRHFGSEEAVPAEFRGFLDAVDEAYHQADADRSLLERAMDLSSQELMQANSELRQSERAFRDSASLLQATLDSTADGIMAVDLKGRIVELNLQLMKMWQIPERLIDPPQSEEILTFALKYLEEPDRMRARLREIYAQPDAESKDVAILRDGRVFEVYSQPQRTGGETVGRVWSCRDVTESRRLEKERARLQIVGALGHLVGALAHEVRNPLFAITATLETIEAGLADHPSPFFQQAIANLREPTRRLSELMADLLEYGKPPSTALAESSLIEIVSQAVSDCARLAAERGVRMSTRLNGWEPRVGAVRPRLLIALHNLIQNAIQHTPRGGEVTVEVEEFELAGSPWVRCRFLDSGTGFRAEDLSRIFEPFFTRRRGGTGLGLSIVQRIVEEHGGRVCAGNRPEGGAVMTLELPHWGRGEPPQPQDGGFLERATLS
jgi:PAS domain S-box-containing protein